MDNGQTGHDTLCYNCGEKPISQEGEKLRLCESCFKELCKIIEDEKKAQSEE